MFKVFEFLLKRINFIIFLVLEAIAVILIVQNNPYQEAAFFTSSNQTMASVAAFSGSVKDYTNLIDANSELATENANLRRQLAALQKYKEVIIANQVDTNFAKRYRFVAAKVINNSTLFTHNYITINKGYADSIKPGMGVVCAKGIVGKVKSCSERFATITSLLHKDIKVSSKLKRQQVVGSVQWPGSDARIAQLMYVPRHIPVKIGDTVVTSEFNSVFPEGEMIGRIKKIEIKGDESFYRLQVAISVDFYALNFVYVIQNKFRLEQDTLESSVISARNERK